MFTPCLVSELDNTTFVVSVSDTQGPIQIRKTETDISLVRDTHCWKTKEPLVTLVSVLKYCGTALPSNTLFVDPNNYTAYPKDYILHCALHYLPSQGVWGIQTPM